jgi:hypothetical protein
VCYGNRYAIYGEIWWNIVDLCIKQLVCGIEYNISFGYLLV